MPPRQKQDAPNGRGCTMGMHEVGLAVVEGQFCSCCVMVVHATDHARVGDMCAHLSLPNGDTCRITMLADGSALTLTTRLTEGMGWLRVDAATCYRSNLLEWDALGFDGSEVQLSTWIDHAADADMLVAFATFDRGRTGFVSYEDFRGAMRTYAAKAGEQLTDAELDEALSNGAHNDVVAGKIDYLDFVRVISAR